MSSVTINQFHWYDNLHEECTALARRDQCSFEVVSTEAFWPTVKFTGPDANLKLLLIKYCGFDVETAKTFYFPDIRVH